ncbi:histidine kinase dimerization/phospho-acceptor domain-containing protein [Fusibacter bizertensis]|uniref:histidine kinase n=1 Tax=Fusibacter bizertensis TaxID=1488331 RepID=A0ABT6NCG5_9FIRM|nr:histidine kinase dimerization/phospho-acceptor domain-containing protein [Fusibacter bizertensis]MDH8678109.1 histidine kinase dimerization/phospho-acceptor domain-containing protein [Fusibacter bizertensis]
MNIRQKLFFQIGSLMLLFILLLFLANTFLLEPFYVQSEKRKLLSTYENLNAMHSEAIDSNTLYTLQLKSSTFIEIEVINETDGTIIIPKNPDYLSTTPSDREGPKPPPFERIIIEKEESVNQNLKYVWFEDPQKGTHFFMLSGYLDSGLHIEIRVPMTSINENVGFLNQFLLIAGVVILVVTIFSANIISKHFTTPILNMFAVTDNIKKLDFSSSCEVLANDELGKLAENINEMSYSLKNNLNQLEENNKELKIEIDERHRIDEQRKALLSNVSHELKTPLSLVQGYSEGLKLSLNKNPEKIAFYCDVIIDEAKKMDLLVSELLDINRIQFSDIPLYKESIVAKDFIDYILKKYEPMLKSNNIKLSYNFSITDLKSPIILSIDALRSEQIITNLMNNALAYVDEHQIIDITVALNQPPKNKKNDSTHLRIDLANSHPPVEPDELQNWWESFYKADKARTRENGGYGLGLSIIKAIQEADNNEYGVYYDEGMIHFYVDFDVA